MKAYVDFNNQTQRDQSAQQFINHKQITTKSVSVSELIQKSLTKSNQLKKELKQ